jgi:hypothetical protein
MGAPTLDNNAHGTRPLCYKQQLVGRKAGAYEPMAAGRGNVILTPGSKREGETMTWCLLSCLQVTAHRVVSGSQQDKGETRQNGPNDTYCRSGCKFSSFFCFFLCSCYHITMNDTNTCPSLVSHCSWGGSQVEGR